MRQTLKLGRYFVLLAVAATLVASAGTFIWGAAKMMLNLTKLFGSLGGEAASADVAVVHMISVVDSFLLATVLYIFALALYELFIGELEVPHWLVIRNLDDLKKKLVSVIILIMAVTFLKHLVEWKNAAETLMFGGGIALVLTALVFYTQSAGKHHSSKYESDE